MFQNTIQQTILLTSKREKRNNQYDNIGVAETTESKKNYAENNKNCLTSDNRSSKLKVQSKYGGHTQ